jgi:glyoxylase-like metal-dependent hydrolase (beta-lactamase superfamily II)
VKPGIVRLDKVVTNGTFCLDGQTWSVDNNVWIVGDDSEVVIIDAAHVAEPVIAAVAGRSVKAILATHGHNDHITAAPELSRRLDAPIWLHPGDDMLWRQTHPEITYQPIEDNQRVAVAGADLIVLNTPGHSPGSSCIYAPELEMLFSGDTLFRGGPGATGRSFSSFPTIVTSISEKVLTLPPNVKVLTGHGDSTTIASEAPHLEEWIARGH